MPQHEENARRVWATEKVKEIASEKNRQIDAISWNTDRERDAFNLVIESRGEKTTTQIPSFLFNENRGEDALKEIEKYLKMAVRNIKLDK